MSRVVSFGNKRMNNIEARNIVQVKFDSPSVAMTAAKTIMPAGYTLSFPMGYW
jgi:hypothetical protein